MRLFGFYAPSMAWLALLIVPLVLFYFLKLKRPRAMIPSLVLWQQVINDQRVNSPFQRFKRNLLLLLQLILLGAVIAAATQPFWRGRVSRISRLPILIDCSASMAALDKPGGVSRLDAAKQKVREIIGGLLSDQEVCLISFDRTARKWTDFTGNRKILLEALAQIAVQDVPSDVEDALRMTEALARSYPFGEVLLFSDGNFPTQADFELSFSLNYQKLPPAGPNVGITSLNANRTPDGMWDVFARFEGSPDAETAATVEVTRDEAPAGKENVRLAKGQSERMVFRISGDRASSVEVKLFPDGFDSLGSDNRALIELPALRSLWVFAAPSLVSYRHALSALPAIRLFPDEQGKCGESSFDLVITDRAEDLALEGRISLYVGLVPKALSHLLTVGKEGTAVVDWRRDSPILQHIEMKDMVILDNPRSGENVREGDYESLGYEVLVHGGNGPLLLEKRSGEKLAYSMLFHSDRSTFPYRIGFPILISNLVRLAMQQTGLAEVRANPTGVLPPIGVRSENSLCRVEGPDGYTREEKSDGNRKLSGIPAPHVGHYSIFEQGTKVAEVGASLLSARETGLLSIEQIQFNEGLSVTAASGGPKMDRSLWALLAMIGFCVLLVEWLYYHRSPGWFAGAGN